MRATPGKLNQKTRQLVDRILSSGQLTRQEHLQLTSLLLAASPMTDEECSKINRIFDYIQMRRVTLKD